MSLHVAITHYERPVMLTRLVRQLLAQAGDGRSERTHDVVIHVYDDHSSETWITTSSMRRAGTTKGGF